MYEAIAHNFEAIKSLADRYGVRRLDLIGSGLRSDSHDAKSDFDFVVEFESLSTSNAADR